MTATVLYTPQVLGLTIELARYPLSDDLPLRGEARSKSCGSMIALGLNLDRDGTIDRVGVRTQACAIGQAAAAIFAGSAIGLQADAIEQARSAVLKWLSGDGPLPDWPSLASIAAARDYPARHGAVMLPWNAAGQALSAC